MIEKINLDNFRNFKEKNLDFTEGINIIVGPNGSGKTNILESLFLLSTGKSFRAKIEAEMIRYTQDITKVKGDALEVIITAGDNGWPKKKLTINGVPKRLIDFAGSVKVVLFGPWDMGLITDAPSLRRKFLDTVLSQVDKEYRRSLASYEKGLRQRNRLLLRIREEGISRSQLLFWDKLLIKNGDYISGKREEFITFTNATPKLNNQIFEVVYGKNAISQARLEQYSQEEVAAATTLVGPHRDDMLFRIRNVGSGVKRDLSAYGSRGEQRMGVLWLKMAELAYVEEKTNQVPTLLLDDIFSELDHEHRGIVMQAANKGQTIITTADEHYIKYIKDSDVILL